MYKYSQIQQHQIKLINNVIKGTIHWKDMHDLQVLKSKFGDVNFLSNDNKTINKSLGCPKL